MNISSYVARWKRLSGYFKFLLLLLFFNSFGAFAIGSIAVIALGGTVPPVFWILPIFGTVGAILFLVHRTYGVSAGFLFYLIQCFGYAGPDFSFRLVSGINYVTYQHHCNHVFAFNLAAMVFCALHIAAFFIIVTDEPIQPAET